jgi:hypothetical protein
MSALGPGEFDVHASRKRGQPRPRAARKKAWPETIGRVVRDSNRARSGGNGSAAPEASGFQTRFGLDWRRGSIRVLVDVFRIWASGLAHDFSTWCPRLAVTRSERTVRPLTTGAEGLQVKVRPIRPRTAGRRFGLARGKTSPTEYRWKESFRIGSARGGDTALETIVFESWFAVF